MNWETNFPESNTLDGQSPIIIFKHSPRCSISNMAKSRLERNWPSHVNIPIYLIDVLLQRNISNFIAEKFNVTHQSPQILVINNGNCIYNESHNGISVEAVLNAIH